LILEKRIEKMESFLQKNLEELKKRDPDLAARLEKTNPSGDLQVLFSRDGLPVTRNGHTTLHSLRDPVKDGRDWANRQRIPDNHSGKKRIAVFGLGTGYHIKALLDRGCTLITVLEPRLDVIRLALEWVDFSAYLQGIDWVVDIEKIPDLKEFVYYLHQPSARSYKDLFPLWTREFPRTGDAPETIADLKKAFEGNKAINAFLDTFPADEPLNLNALVERILKTHGPVEDWQVIFLLIHEFGKRG
jgi:hypothetical protein